MLAEEQRLNITTAGTCEIMVQTNAGIVATRIAVDEQQQTLLSFDAPVGEMKSVDFSSQDLCDILQLDNTQVNQQTPPLFETRNQDCFINLNSYEALAQLALDTRAVKKFCQQHDIVALCFLWHDISSATVHTRCFAPLWVSAKIPLRALFWVV